MKHSHRITRPPPSPRRTRPHNSSAGLARAMAGKSIIIKLLSTAGSGYFYATKKNPSSVTHKLAFMKYDPIVRTHVLFTEAKMCVAARLVAARRRRRRRLTRLPTAPLTQTGPRAAAAAARASKSRARDVLRVCASFRGRDVAFMLFAVAARARLVALFCTRAHCASHRVLARAQHMLSTRALTVTAATI